jgi:beta-lactamase superfamily II metal-dependent hydrolase
MLKLHFLNVGQGSSAVVEFTRGDCNHFGLIDSNCPLGESPRALQKLRDLACHHLSFVALTHPHDDHYGDLINVLMHIKARLRNSIHFQWGFWRPTKAE